MKIFFNWLIGSLLVVGVAVLIFVFGLKLVIHYYWAAILALGGIAFCLRAFGVK